MSFVTANGVRHHVRWLGPRAGRPVVLVHGLIVGNMAGWYFSVAQTLAARRPVMLYDLRGHGLSERTPSGYDVATLTDDLEALTADLAGPLTVIGHSYGGLLALRLASRQPGRVERLGLVETPIPPTGAAEMDAFLARSPEAMIAALPVPAQTGRRGSRLLRTVAALVGETTLLADLRAEPAIDDATLAQVQAPTLCVYGTRSACLPVADRLSAALPHVEVTRLEGGHYLHLDAPTALAERLERFVG